MMIVDENGKPVERQIDLANLSDKQSSFVRVFGEGFDAWFKGWGTSHFGENATQEEIFLAGVVLLNQAHKFLTFAGMSAEAQGILSRNATRYAAELLAEKAGRGE